MEDNKIPYHVAIIMDGNGRWAKERGKVRSYGHEMGAKTLKELALYAFSKGVKVLSVFAFSTENFKRSEEEVGFLMNLFIKLFNTEFKIFNEKNIKVVFSKKESGLPDKLENIIKDVTEKTKDNKNGIFNVCINYGGQDEIVDVVKKISKKVLDGNINIDDINKNIIEENLYQKLPPIDLLIRTSGEYRISNYMLWQMAYSEMYFTNTYFPDFDEFELKKAIEEYSKRDRRFGNIEDKK